MKYSGRGLSEQEKAMVEVNPLTNPFNHRFDVLIDETHPIHVGEFDIAL